MGNWAYSDQSMYGCNRFNEPFYNKKDKSALKFSDNTVMESGQANLRTPFAVWIVVLTVKIIVMRYHMPIWVFVSDIQISKHKSVSECEIIITHISIIVVVGHMMFKIKNISFKLRSRKGTEDNAF